MNAVKKSAAAVLCLIMILSFASFLSFAQDDEYIPKEALSVNAGIEALCGQFESFTGPEKDGYAIDCKYYSPVGENDSNKYPIVIFFHGINHGESVGSQLNDSDFPYWSSSEFQARFSESGGVFILMPRAPEDKKLYWGETFISPVKAMIHSFIEEHSENVDTTSISITGSSAGGGMCWLMLDAFPGMFSCAFPLASTITPSKADIEKAKDTAIWIFASKKGRIVNYNFSTLKIWNNVTATNSRPGLCRLTSFENVHNPDGTPTSTNHHLASVITYDMHMKDESDYIEAETINGNGDKVSLTSPEGIISWISSVHSDYNGNEDRADPEYNLTFFTKINNFFKYRIFYLVQLIQDLLGL